MNRWWRGQVTRAGMLSALLLAACQAGERAATPTVPPPTAAEAHEAAALPRAPDVPPLPFPDNPDPDACGIPAPWDQDDPAWLTGVYGGELVQPTVLLYDSHLRLRVTGAAPSGTPVQVLLFQSNPVLNFYFVRVPTLEPPQEGWVPAPFLRFEPPAGGQSSAR